MLYRSGDVVYVQPVMWVAQLQAAIIREKQIVNGRRVTLVVNVDRVPCRYFVSTAELGSYKHALEWWQTRGPSPRLVDAAAAVERAEASIGIHFSFEKVDRVSHMLNHSRRGH